MRTIAFALLLFILTACSPKPPLKQHDICQIFRLQPSWYWAAQASAKRWHIPIAVQMAILHKESHFRAGAIPPRHYIWGFIPWFRASSAYGYAQAIDATWQLYQLKTGRHGASRSNFKDATDFIAWFAERAHRELGISRANAYALYLAYHQGIEGYREHSYRHNIHLIHNAFHVESYANLYQRQLYRCEKNLPKKPWWRFWD